VNKVNHKPSFVARVPDPGSGAFLIQGSGIDKKIKIRIRDEHAGSYFRELRTIFWVKILKCIDADPGILLILDPGSEIGKIRIRDKHPGFATLFCYICWEKRTDETKCPFYV
jgi:hypothetical protein